MYNQNNLNPEIKDRQHWMRLLATAPVDTLETAWHLLEDKPGYTMLRDPEVGMAMVRGRAGGTGGRFNLGEMTLTRCVVRLNDGTTGHAYVAGRDKRKTELAAAFDAMLQTTGYQENLNRTLIQPLEIQQTAHRKQRSQKVQSTRVDFFTMVRGEG